MPEPLPELPVDPSIKKTYAENAPIDFGASAVLEECKVALGGNIDDRFNQITSAMQQIFQTPVSLVCLLCNDLVYFRSACGYGTETPDPQPRCNAWCNYIQVPTTPEVLIIENSPEDGRFAINPYTLGPPFLKFYAGAPLVSTGDNLRYGTLCLMDFVPRSFTAEMYAVLSNFAELVVQELERDSGMVAQWSKTAMAEMKDRFKLRSCLSSATDGVAMMDTRDVKFPFMYSNDLFGDASGIPSDKISQTGFWELFHPLEMTKDELVYYPANGQSVTTSFLSVVNNTKLILSLRPACTDQMSPDKPIGVPAWVPSEKQSNVKLLGPLETVSQLCMNVERCFFLVIVEEVLDYRSSQNSESSILSRTPSVTEMGSDQGSFGSSQSTISTIPALGPRLAELSMLMPTKKKPEHTETQQAHKMNWKKRGSACTYGDFVLPESLEGRLVMGTIVGSGTFGKVYRGILNTGTENKEVAVKIVECRSGAQADDADAEGLLGLTLEHPNVVQTIFCSAQVDRKTLAVKQSMTRQDNVSTKWLVQEYCDQGMLFDSVSRAHLRISRDITAPQDMQKIYTTILDIAQGLAYMHSKGLMHGDLNGRNVMLKSDESRTTGFIAKICDFGMSRVCLGEKMHHSYFGTITHCPPEMIISNSISLKTDVWSFGVIMWEIYVGKKYFFNTPHAAVLYQISKGAKPELPSDCPADYKAIMENCLRTDPHDRITSSSLVNMIQDAASNAVSSMEM